MPREQKPIQVFVEDDLLKSVRKKLIDDGKTLSELVRELLEKYVKEPSEK
jgi:metal-responsive CopG/Arc/MetJ family transcriptional regulator